LINLFGPDSKNKNMDKNKMYKRLGDLQNLELKYLKAKENSMLVTNSKNREKFYNFNKAL